MSSKSKPSQYNLIEIESALVGYGLTPKQARIYLTALQLGEASVQEIAAAAKIQRTNTYDAVRVLTDQGLISISTRGKRSVYIAEPPDRLLALLDEKREQLGNALPQLRTLHNLSDTKPKIHYYPGLEGCKAVYEDTLNAKEKRLFGIYSIRDTIEIFGKEYADRMVDKRVKRGIPLQVIRSRETEITPSLYPSSARWLREVRRAPRGMIFPVLTYVYDNKVAILSSKKELFGLLIESNDIAQAHRNYFQALWQISEPISDYTISA